MGGFTSAAALGAGYYYYNNNNNNNNVAIAKSQPTTQSTQSAIQQAFHELQKVLPSEHVTVDEETLQLHGYSNNSYHNEGSPNIVVYPTNTQEVVQIVKIANTLNVPIIAFSGGTSLEGHFTAPQGGICISFTEHMDKVVEFHPDDLDIVVQPGVQWENLNAQLKEHGLFFPMDPGPGACIGGMVGTGCSGTNAVRWGTMREWVINLTVVMADGKVIKTRQRPRKSSAGYDLTKLFIGSEGTLGIVTEATLKLAVRPQEETVAVCDFPTVRDAAAVVPDLTRAGVQIGAVELLDEEMMKAVRMASPQLGYQAKPTLFFKFVGSKAQIEHEIKVVSDLVKKHQGGQFKYAKTQAEKDDLWEGRKTCLWSATMLKENASVWTTDVVVPVSRLPELIAETKKDVSESSLPCPFAGHAGDGNFHLFILFDKNIPSEFEEATRLNQNLIQRAIKMEGSITGEHGVGFGKKKYLRDELGDNTVDLMWTIKNAMDPKGIMNPGKVLPDPK
ncbi:hypothetical protein BDB00DRAFT_766871 [Zychaea mexicana]|uniref:uncharacterized protein n=1 Tax=Zychaea mexicana TaxID=64656 RepID=UPI0022FE8BC1|nr:uncharacterized protein BDB00DRAFT_766871 [Zychaea mexicana]KAI9491529.1 hypothetical protein BDB00DRAFT_766871 [Zychaea mexicana]